MGIQGRAPYNPTGRITLPKGGSGTSKPSQPMAYGNCVGCGAALRVATCDYCGRNNEPKPVYAGTRHHHRAECQCPGCATVDPKANVVFRVGKR